MFCPSLTHLSLISIFIAPVRPIIVTLVFCPFQWPISRPHHAQIFHMGAFIECHRKPLLPPLNLRIPFILKADKFNSEIS